MFFRLPTSGAIIFISETKWARRRTTQKDNELREVSRALRTKTIELDLAIDRNKPKLSAEFWQIVTGRYSLQSGEIGVHFMANVALKNLGADSIARDWKLSVISSELNTIETNATFIEDGFKLEIGSETATFTASNRLEERTMTPIKAGSMTAGWIRFMLPNADTEAFMRARVVLHFKDILGTPYWLEKDMNEGIGPPTIGYYPGSGGNPFQKSTV
jgi:hypothetical protein